MSRKPRIAPPRVPSGKLALQPPPELVPSEGGGSLLTSLLPMLGSVGSIAMVTISNQGPAGYLTGGMFLLSSLGFVAVNGWRQRSQRNAEVLGNRREYLAYLTDLRETVRTAAKQQRRFGNWISPAPATLPFLAEDGARVWERERSDGSFLLTRVGVSDQPLCIEMVAPELPPLAQLDPVAASSAHRFMLTHEMQPALPIAVPLAGYQRVEITGDSVEDVRGLARAMMISLATLQHPEDVQIAVLADENNITEWEWAKWLPHVASTRVRDRLGASRMISSSLDDIVAMLPAELADRPRFSGEVSEAMSHIILLTDGIRIPSRHPILGVASLTVIDLPETWSDLDDPLTLRLALSGQDSAAAEMLEVGAMAMPFTPDLTSIAEVESTARRLTPLYTEATVASGEGAAAVSTKQRELVDLLSLPDVREMQLATAWAPRRERDRLRVPIGQDTTGAPMVLDLKEAAQQGMGPHGIMIGATGSGKSEVLRTLVLALALTHSPEQLNFVLVDFKGGATFAGMAGMPHVSAIITNLGSELALVDRFQDALQGEVVRRQELLRASGNFANVTDYEKARKGGRTDLAPLPALLIVADEFSELLAAKPEFVESFINIGRVGRSLAVHLLLASQRLEEGKLRGLDTYLSYRIGLRTFSAAESRSVLGVPDAYTLPQEPGVGYLKSGTEDLVQFRAAYVSGRPKNQPRTRSELRQAAEAPKVQIEWFTAAAQPIEEEVEEASEEQNVVVVSENARDERSTFELAVDRMMGHGPAAHQVWLPPLDTPPSLDELMPDLAVDPRFGLSSARWRSAGSLTVPLGIVDVPLEQRREWLTVSLGGAAGHVAVVGGPLSGKSTLLRTLVSSLSLAATPHEVQFYVLDFGGGSFAGMQQHPHIAGVAMRTEQDAVRRSIAEVESVLDAREKYFRANGIDSIDTYRSRRAQGIVDDGYGDVFLIIDGWATLRAEYEALEARVQAIAARGLSFGVHVVVTANRWLEVRANLKDLIQTRIELRLGDPSDSEVDRKQAQNVPAGAPGRGLSPAKLHMLTALPRVDGVSEAASLFDGVQNMIDRLTAAWTGEPGPKLRMLPELVPLEEVQQLAGEADRNILLGLDEAELAPFGINPRTEPHMYLYGDSGMGKSSFLRGIVREITRLYSASEAKIFLVDYRRSLLGEVPKDYLGAYLTSHEMASSGLEELRAFFASRIPGPDVTAQELRDRSWWKGAEGFILVDDYDLVATSQGNPVSVLQPLLAQASDLGLHVIITRRSGGASRAAYDPIIQRFTDLGVTGILLGGNPEEGALIGRVKPVVSGAGRAQVVSRDRGTFAAQLAFAPAEH